MRWVFPLVAVATGGCFVLDCPRGDVYCDGDVLTRCRSTCTGDSKTNRSCSPTITTTDCTTVLPGVKKACRAGACLDAPLTSCASSDGACLPDGRLRTCAKAGAEQYLDTRECERAGLVCVPVPGYQVCVDAARTPCDPAQYPRCESGRYDVHCTGSADAGHFLRTNDCGAGRLCKQDADSGITFCADP